jgi:hypothetical protein
MSATYTEVVKEHELSSDCQLLSPLDSIQSLTPSDDRSRSCRSEVCFLPTGYGVNSPERNNSMSHKTLSPKSLTTVL